MIKASALYIVIVIALVIAVLCSSIIVAAYFYKTQYQRKSRYDLLELNVTSGINILLGGNDRGYFSKKVSLFNGDQDSVVLKNICWGLYDIKVARSFIQKDTLTRVFSTGYSVDSSKWAALYIIDENRPLSVSGKTEIKGNAFIPKAGIKEAYVDNMAYKGDKELVQGLKKNSAKILPGLNPDRLSNIKALFNVTASADSTLTYADSLGRSFNEHIKVISLGKKVVHLQNKLSGYILIRSDTTITIDNSAQLNNVIIYARSINVEAGFKGTCQLFATDSIHIQAGCRFEYPSVIGVFRLSDFIVKAPPKIVIDAGTMVNGIVFIDQKTGGEVKPMIILGDRTTITGQIYTPGILNYKKQFFVNGSVFTNRFIYQSGYTMYENYLINAQLNSKKLSPYYLSSELMPVSSNKKKILQWLK